MDIKKVVEAKTIEDLNALEKELNAEIDKQIKDENEIVQAVQDITSSLLTYSKSNADINGKKYMIKMKINETGKVAFDAKGNQQPDRQTVLMAVDTFKASVMEGRYTPYIVRADFNPNLTLKENTAIAVEGFIRHITGIIKPEMLEQ